VAMPLPNGKPDDDAFKTALLARDAAIKCAAWTHTHSATCKEHHSMRAAAAQPLDSYAEGLKRRRNPPPPRVREYQSRDESDSQFS
jgi:hypothetical protein